MKIKLLVGKDEGKVIEVSSKSAECLVRRRKGVTVQSPKTPENATDSTAPAKEKGDKK